MVKLIATLILEVFPDLLRIEFYAVYFELNTGFVHVYLTILFIIPLPLMIRADIRKVNLKSIPLSLLIIFSTIGGNALFLIAFQYQEGNYIDMNQLIRMLTKYIFLIIIASDFADFSVFMKPPLLFGLPIDSNIK